MKSQEQASGLAGRLRAKVAGAPSTANDHRWVFVVTYGRSGSTLVQGLLNKLPRTLVRGENNFYILPLYRAKEMAGRFQAKHIQHAARDTSAFWGLRELDLGAFDTSTRDLVTTLLLGESGASDFDVLGFKEVLWHRVPPKDTENFFAFLDDAFPGVRFVLNQRTHENVVGSGFWQKGDEQQALRAISRVEDIQQFLRTTRPDRVYDIRYEVITGDDATARDRSLRGLAEFVHGSCDDLLLGELRETLKTGFGPNPFGVSRGRPKQEGDDAQSDE